MTTKRASGSIDRRGARTRRLLQEALFKLTAEKGYADVTVEDICREANVGRSTFYTHYPAKDGLRKATIDEHMKAITACGDVQNSPTDAKGILFSGPLFVHAASTREMHRSLMGGKKREMPDEIRDWIKGQVRSELASIAAGQKKDVLVEGATRFVVGAFSELMHWWLDGETGLSPAAIDQLFQRIAFGGVHSLFPPQHDADNLAT